MKKLLLLDFLPRNANLGLLVLRLTFGLGMLWLHGRGKLLKYSQLRDNFEDPLGVGSHLSLILALLGEVACPALIAVGAFTRFAALGAAITMAVAFFIVHEAQVLGANNGEMSLLYFTVFLTLFLTGAGRYSIDAKLGAKL